MKSLPELSSNSSLTLILVGLTAAAILLIASIVSVATVIACRKPAVVRRRHRCQTKSSDDLELSEAGFGEGFQRRSAQYRASMYAETEERISRLIEGKSIRSSYRSRLVNMSVNKPLSCWIIRFLFVLDV